MLILQGHWQLGSEKSQRESFHRHSPSYPGQCEYNEHRQERRTGRLNLVDSSVRICLAGALPDAISALFIFWRLSVSLFAPRSRTEIALERETSRPRPRLWRGLWSRHLIHIHDVLLGAQSYSAPSLGAFPGTIERWSVPASTKFRRCGEHNSATADDAAADEKRVDADGGGEDEKLPG